MSFIDTDLRSNAFAIRRLEPDGLEAFDISRLSETNIGRLRRSFDVDDEAAVQATGNSVWFGGEIRSRVGRPLVANARKCLSIIRDRLRNDRGLADFTQFKIKENQHPTEQPS